MANTNGGGEGEVDGMPTLTTRQGHPVSDNQNNRTIGDRGPTVLENYHFLEKISHFDRERIPERVVHARGAGAHGFFEPTGLVGDEPISRYTRARLFQEAGARTPMFARFSTVVTAITLPKRSAIRAALPSSSTRRTATGISWGTTCRCSSSATR